MTRRWLALAIVAASAPSGAGAEPWRGYLRVPVGAPPAAAVSSRIVYLHRCPAGGCAVQFGTVDDSRTQTSSIAMGSRTIGAFTQGDAVWAAFVQCVQMTYAPFDVTVTDIDPGNVPHFEEIVGGRPSDLRSDIPNAGGISPFTCAEIPNSISFTFDVYGPDAESLCWTAAQETAHGYGLDHEYLQMDPMTYMGGDLPKRYQDVDAPCGEFQIRPCNCPRQTQNSYLLIVGLFGPGAPSPPTVAITEPVDGKHVQPGFVVRVAASDIVAVDHVELYLDGALAGSMMTAPYAFTTPPLGLGSHAIEARAIDVQGTPASAMVGVDVVPPCTASAGCDGTDVCVMGLCVAGPDQPGGLGAVCQANDQCVSLQCANGGEALLHCVEPCDPATSGSCPHGFDCLAAAQAGVCWPSPAGGCCQTGGGPHGPVVLGAAVVSFVLRRRRRR